MIIAAKASKEFQDVKVLKNSCKMKELGKVKFVFGMKIDHDRNGSTLIIRNPANRRRCKKVPPAKSHYRHQPLRSGIKAVEGTIAKDSPSEQ